jgi:hypothetical protein
MLYMGASSNAKWARMIDESAFTDDIKGNLKPTMGPDGYVNNDIPRGTRFRVNHAPVDSARDA